MAASCAARGFSRQTRNSWRWPTPAYRKFRTQIANKDQHPTPCNSRHRRRSRWLLRFLRSSTACHKKSANGAQLQGTGSGRRSRCRTELREASTVVKDVRSTSRTKSPRGDARAATARNTCTPKVSTEKQASAVFWRCCSDAAASALDQGLFALEAVWAQLVPTSSSTVVRLVQV